jgi:polyisoprenoid-binding protein YceI
MVTKVRGAFNDVAGSGYFDVDEPTRSHLDVVIQAASIDTRNADRDGHLRSNDFFDMETYPEITFTSTSVSPTGENDYDVTGDLTIKGVTKSITIPFEVSGPATDPFGATRIGLEGRVVINRKDWGVNWNAALETGGVLISEKVTLEFEVSAVIADAASDADSD